MHLLAAAPGRIDDGGEAIDLGQTPGEIVVLTAADSEVACLAAAQARRLAASSAAPVLRLANLLRLAHPLSVDLYVERIVRPARLVVVRLLGGRGYWPYGVDEIEAACRERGIPAAFLPGDDQPDAALSRATTVAAPDAFRLWQYLVHGGIVNAEHFLAFAATLAGRDDEWREPAPLLRAGWWRRSDVLALRYAGYRLAPQGEDYGEESVRHSRREKEPHPEEARRAVSKDEVPSIAARPRAVVVCYRALVQAGDMAAIDALVAALEAEGIDAAAMYVQSLRDPGCAAFVTEALAAGPPDIVLNATSFAVARPGAPEAGPFAASDCPVLQVVLAGSGAAAWRDGANGLAARDIAMNVALPEVDGRILSRAIAFKDAARRDMATEADIVAHVPVADRVAFTARLAASWCRLRRKAAGERRIAIVLANYPNRDGRMGNGVGLDVPASTVGLLADLANAGYRIEGVPEDCDALMAALAAGPTNAGIAGRRDGERLMLPDYEIFLGALPPVVRNAVSERWGPPTGDPFFRPGELDCGAFAVPALVFGNVAIVLQPARGYNIDPASSYHDPALVPPHGYLAVYAWLRDTFRADAVVHMGKHGNLEWLPGKAVALSEACFPEAALGPLPNLYPFIVNDPGEGTQAKRRAAAVIVDHLTPPLARAGAQGGVPEVERLVDEYWEAANLDPRRLPLLSKRIAEAMVESGLDRDLGLPPGTPVADALGRLDAWLCELKELQIRDGLHVFGRSPEGAARDEMLAAMVRLPRGPKAADASLPRALAADLDLDLDPLAADAEAPWTGQRPAGLDGYEGVWRSAGDTVERIEALALDLIAGRRAAEPGWPRTTAVLAEIEARLRPAIAASGAAETAALLAGLDGRFVAPGPSGAPTRGRPEVLPTGRNFFSVDVRAVPTPEAWELGWRSASLLVEAHAQKHGDWPRAMALSAWGTANMRTGGDDIAQALALLGVRPLWEDATRRVIGFEVMPVSVLGRPRVDVTLRVSGFFRDAFASLIELFDSAVAAVAARTDEAPRDNPVAHCVAVEAAALTAEGVEPGMARRQASYRVFGSPPGAYGAGLQALIDERGWDSPADLAKAYLAWGGYAYGAGAATGGGGGYGAPAARAFARRLTAVQAVIHNQDNREHDLLDSDDYYQFEGGLVATVEHLSGRRPTAWHNDHSRPERPRIGTLEDEISRIVRARAANPKWIAGVMRHGYKGAFEMAATVDYLFAFAATTGAVRDDQFDRVYAAYLEDDAVRDFIADSNPAALREMAQRFLEAIDRALWTPRANSARDRLTGLAAQRASRVEA
ncbi:MAG: cobaltochelatase subunit CobN [Alphaproteobacteria bacterium]|nr:cobaltochelatase subunit CobN [Alphaproteobacteria bacterium]